MCCEVWAVRIDISSAALNGNRWKNANTLIQKPDLTASGIETACPVKRLAAYQAKCEGHVAQAEHEDTVDSEGGPCQIAHERRGDAPESHEYGVHGNVHRDAGPLIVAQGCHDVPAPNPKPNISLPHRLTASLGFKA